MKHANDPAKRRLLKTAVATAAAAALAACGQNTRTGDAAQRPSENAVSAQPKPISDGLSQGVWRSHARGLDCWEQRGFVGTAENACVASGRHTLRRVQHGRVGEQAV